MARKQAIYDRERILGAPPRTLPADGVRRRIQALHWLGWTARHIAEAGGCTSPEAVAVLAKNILSSGIKTPDFFKSSGGLGALTDRIKTAAGFIRNLAGAVLSFGRSGPAAFLSAATSARTFAQSLASSQRARFDGFIARLVSLVSRQAIPSLLKFSKTFLLLNDTIRYAAQGITNIGRSLFFFISIPLAGFLTRMSGGAIDFDDAMKRVAKTTSLSGENLSNLQGKLRELATVTSTSHVELAKIAEVVGQMHDQGLDEVHHRFDQDTVNPGGYERLGLTQEAGFNDFRIGVTVRLNQPAGGSQ